MRPAYVVEIETPKGVLLNGLWFGPRKARRVIIWVHGLSSTMFSKQAHMAALLDKHTAVLAFNNRGHDKVSRLIKKNGKRDEAGGAHEVFTDCVDDIDGVIRFAKRQGSKQIFLAGHSTGCQKSMYWASKKGRGVKGLFLLAPLSDYAAEVYLSGREKVAAALTIAKKMMREGKAREFVPVRVWPSRLLADARRYVSLYSGQSAEEIFTYWEPKRNPKTLRSVKLPILVVLAEKDQYAQEPAKKLAGWFTDNLKKTDKVTVISHADHGFRGSEKTVARIIRNFMKENR